MQWNSDFMSFLSGNFNRFMFIQTHIFPKFTLIFSNPDSKILPEFMFTIVQFFRIRRKSAAILFIFKACHSETGISLHIKVFQPHVRELCRLGAQRIKKIM
jgi:hypothetical protein